MNSPDATWENLDEPFPHVRIGNVFSPTTYGIIQRYMPDASVCHELRHRDAILPDGKSSRLQFGFSTPEMAMLSDCAIVFWTRLIAVLTDTLTTAMVMEHLEAGLREKWGNEWYKIRLKPQPWLIRDLGGYKITPHPDIPQKNITLQIYLPEDDSQSQIGTSLYRKDGDSFTEVSRVPFVPNSGYAFAVTDRSWHGVEQVPSDGKPRNSLMLIYYKS